MGYWDNQGATPTKITWQNPEIVPEAQRQNGGWYANQQTGLVERWWSGDNASGSASAATGSVPAGTGVGISMPNQPKLDLNSLYEQNLNTPEIKALKDELSAKERAFNEEKALRNDNPWYSEATRVGKIAKLEEAYNADKQTITNQLAQKTADAQLKINLATQQYNIDNENYKNTVAQYNSLLNSGALVNANGTDIANMAVALGMPTSMIQAVIDKQKQDLIKPQLVTATDDYGNQTVSVFDQNTGNLIKTTTLKGVGNKQGGAGAGTGYTTTVNKYLPDAVKILQEVDSTTNGKLDLASGKTVGDGLLSRQEYEAALRRIVGLVGDQATGEQLMNAAWESGGFNTWNW